MKKLFLVETTTGDKWELCPGFYLVMAENKDEAKKITEQNLRYGKITSVLDVTKEMKTKTFKIITSPIVE